MPRVSKKDENLFTRSYKPFPFTTNGSQLDQCVPALFKTPDWNRPHFDYGSSYRYSQTYLSQGPATNPVVIKSKSWDYADKAQKMYESLKRTIEHREQAAFLKNLRSYTYIEVYDDIVENIPIRAWVRELDDPAEAVLLNMGALDIELTISRFEPTRITRAYDALEASVLKLTSKTQEIITRFTIAIEKIKKSPKLEPVKKALYMILNKWPKLTSAITHTLRVLRKLVPGVGTIIDIHAAKEKRANWIADPFSEEKRKEYVIAVLSVATNAIIGVLLESIMKHPIGFCVACIYLGYSIWFGMNDGEGEPVANLLYHYLPNAMTTCAMNMDSVAVWINDKVTFVGEVVDSSLEDIKSAAIGVADGAKQIGQAISREGKNALDFSEELFARVVSNPAD